MSLTGEPQEEVRAAKEILKSPGDCVKGGITLVSCPTCGRLDTPELTKIVQELEQRVQSIEKEVTVAVMGCAVNGPGEAREADLGVACGKNEALLIRKGEVVGKIPSHQIVQRLYQEILDFE